MVEYQLPKLVTRVRFPSLAPFYVLLLAVAALAGCATIEDNVAEEDRTWTSRQTGVYHKVRPGETLWRIAKMYDVDIEAIIDGNNIPNAANVEVNQLVFIPGATEVRESSLTTDDPNKNDFAWPVRGKIRNYYGERRQGQSSSGIGIQVPPGETIRAARAGSVVFADYLTGYSYTVMVDHQDGFYTVYSNNAKLVVGLGDQVTKGQPLAEAGRKGAEGFVHFEIRNRAEPENPLYYLPEL